jgi:alkylhydroperoxidase/carboxymuconolactone decarboxylase family protein YurZ
MQGDERMTTRETLRQQGEAMRARLLGDRRPPAEIAAGESTPGFRQMMTEAVFGGIWARPGLGLADRMICTLAALGLLQRLPQLRHYVAAAVDAGLTPRAILEVFVQCGLYGGFPTTETAVTVAREVFAERGIVVPDEPARTDTLETLDARGRGLLEELHGERGSQGYAAPGNAVTGALYPMAIQYGYGELWFRPGLDRRQRMLCAVASFTVLGLESQVRKFGQSALTVGLSRQEVIEAVIQTAPYGGFPRALNALAALSDVLSEVAEA